MNLFFCGDCHGALEHISHHARLEKSEGRPVTAIFLLGDIIDHATTPLEDDLKRIEDQTSASVWLIHGNHEADDEHNWRQFQTAAHRNISGRIIDIGGIRVAGLGGVFRGAIWNGSSNPPPRFHSYSDFESELQQKQGLKQRLSKLDRIRAEAVPDRIQVLMDPTRNGQLRRHQASIFPEVVERLGKQHADILITHEAPGAGLHPYGFEELATLARALGVRASFHGHQHDCLDAHYATLAPSLGFMAHGVGLRGISSYDSMNFEVRQIKPGELDRSRGSRVIFAKR